MGTTLPRQAIRAVGLTKSYGATQVLAGIDFEIERGSVFALLGPNGAGKTTTIRILSTLTAPDTGSARVAGFDVTAQRGEVRRRISLTGQYAAIDELQTGRENLRMMCRLRASAPARGATGARELLDAFEPHAAADRRVAHLLRRDAAAARPRRRPGRPTRVIFLDEPTTGLDPRSRQAMWDVVADLAASGVTVFLTTQYLEEADRLAGHIAVVDQGRIVAEGTPRAQAPGGRAAARHPAHRHRRIRGHRAQLGARAIHLRHGALTIGVPTDGGAAEIRALLDEIDPDAQQCRRLRRARREPRRRLPRPHVQPGPAPGARPCLSTPSPARSTAPGRPSSPTPGLWSPERFGSRCATSTGS